MSMVEVVLDRVGWSGFAAHNAEGGTARLGGPSSLDEQLAARQGKAEIPELVWPPTGDPLRPMQMLLASLGACSAIDVLLVMARQRRPLSDLRITVRGRRADATPAVYETIALHFETSGDIDPERLNRAVELSMEKYCSVTAMLTDVEIAHTSEVHEA